MGAPRVQDRLDEGSPAQGLKDVITGACLAANFLINGHPLPVGGMPRNGGVDFALFALQLAAQDRLINLGYFSARALSGKGAVSLVIFRDHQTAARFFVDTMDHAG